MKTWTFDGHGINEHGERVAKVRVPLYLNPDGKRVRNERFDRYSRLIRAAPEMYEALKETVVFLGEIANIVGGLLSRNNINTLPMRRKLERLLARIEGEGENCGVF